MKKQRNEKPIDEELLMRMMAGEAAGTEEPGTGKVGNRRAGGKGAGREGGGHKTAQGKAGGHHRSHADGHLVFRGREQNSFTPSVRWSA